jgi:hypothetical protein
MMDERDMELELKHQQLSDVFEELKVIRNKLMHDDEFRHYVVEDMVQDLIWRVGKFIGEF